MGSVGLVSVIIPCYNHGRFLSEAIESVLTSTYNHHEIIIVDDGSTDNTREIAERYAKKFPNVHYNYLDNSGPSVARNLGIRNSAGEYILPLDADDKISDRYIEKAIQVLQNDRNIKLVYCDAEFFGQKSGKWELKRFSLKKLALRNMIFSCAMYRKSDYDIAGGYDEKLIHGHEDWDFWISLLKNGGQVHKLKSFIGFYYRIHEQSRRRTTAREYKQSTIELINSKHHSFIISHLNGPIRKPKKMTLLINNLILLTKSPTQLFPAVSAKLKKRDEYYNAAKLKRI
jgi:glycosyltransferase involved in cell wall biosynthesis